jgi:hypothetical protein
MQPVDVTEDYILVDFNPKLKFDGWITRSKAFLLQIFGENINIMPCIINQEEPFLANSCCIARNSGKGLRQAKSSFTSSHITPAQLGNHGTAFCNNYFRHTMVNKAKSQELKNQIHRERVDDLKAYVAKVYADEQRRSLEISISNHPNQGIMP